MSNPSDGHNDSAAFEKILKDAETEVSGPEDKNPGSPSDKQLTKDAEQEEQRARSRVVTTILGQYGTAYRNKVKFQQWCRHVLFWGCSAIIVLFVTGIAIVTWASVFGPKPEDLTGTAAVITAVVSFAVLIVQLVQTITAYCFPENDEQYIVDIVRSIQENDLEKEKEYNRAAEAKAKGEDKPDK